MATLSFAYSYARVNITAFSVVQSRSGCLRTFSQRATLDLFSGRAIAVALSGYMFFGSAINVSQSAGGRLVGRTARPQLSACACP